MAEPGSTNESPIDTAIDIITPENIAFRYRAAGPFRRLPAYLIDLLIRGFVLLVLGGVVALVASYATASGLALASWGIGAYLLVWFVMEWFYGGLFETFWNGQTPGKRLLRLRVMTIEGQPINGLQAVLRNLLRAVDMLPALYLPPDTALPFFQLGLWTMAASDRYQRLGDLAAGTMVVVEEREWAFGVLRVSEPGALQLAAQLPAGFRPSRSLARAVSHYVARRMTFGWQRRVEIALHLAEPLRQKFNLPKGTNPDLLLCALYHRTFIAERPEEVLGVLAAAPAPPAPPAPWMAMAAHDRS